MLAKLGASGAARARVHFFAHIGGAAIAVVATVDSSFCFIKDRLERGLRRNLPSDRKQEG
jgi:hypothetical protein